MKLVVQNAGAVWGGNEKWLSNLARGLSARGHDVVVSCAPGVVRDKLGELGVRTSVKRPRGAIDFVSGLSFAAWLARDKPDVLLLTTWRTLSWCAFAARAARVPRVVMRLGLVRKAPRAGTRALALRSVDALIVNSDEIAETWAASAPWFPAGEVHVVLNGVGAARMTKDDMRARLEEVAGTSRDTFAIGGAGHMAPRKGFDILLRAFAAAAIPAGRLVLIGNGPARHSLERLALELGIQDRVVWLGHRDDAQVLVGGLDLFVLSSHNEGMANVMLEAMAAGTPVIASDVSGVRRAIGESTRGRPAGWIFPAGDSTELASLIRRVTSVLEGRLPEASEVAAEARWRVANWFSLDRMVDECERVLFR